MQSFSALPLFPLWLAGWLTASCLFTSLPAGADLLDDCIHSKLATADDATTIGELRRSCLQEQHVANPANQPAQEQGAVEKRLMQERKNVLKPFTITTHRPNYILPFTYNTQEYSGKHFGKQNNGDPYEFDQEEAEFQISLKTPLMVDLFGGIMDIYAAYTNHSFWQVYNDDLSAPFRESVHEPEAWVQFHPDWQFLGVKNSWNMFGINHQSNGQSGERSRTWNRLLASFVLERDDIALTIRPWVPIFTDGSDWDNPNIVDYFGHYDLLLAYKKGAHTFSIKERNNLESGFTRGSVELAWSFPLGAWPYLRGYVQYFNGYSSSLIDYDQYVNRIGVGFSLSDWL